MFKDRTEANLNPDISYNTVELLKQHGIDLSSNSTIKYFPTRTHKQDKNTAVYQQNRLCISYTVFSKRIYLTDFTMVLTVSFKFALAILSRTI